MIVGCTDIIVSRGRVIVKPILKNKYTFSVLSILQSVVLYIMDKMRCNCLYVNYNTDIAASQQTCS